MQARREENASRGCYAMGPLGWPAMELDFMAGAGGVLLTLAEGRPWQEGPLSVRPPGYIHPSVRPSGQPCILPPHPSPPPPLHPSIPPSLPPSTPTHGSIHPPIHPSIRASIHPSLKHLEVHHNSPWCRGLTWFGQRYMGLLVLKRATEDPTILIPL